MNVEQYIASGKLESYLLDDLTPLEAREVEMVIANNEQVRAAFEELEETYIQLAEKHAYQPSQSLKDSILSQIEEKQETSTGNTWKYLAAASVVLVLASSILAYTYYDSWKSTDAELSELQRKNLEYAENLNRTNYRLDDTEDKLETITSESTKKVLLSGLPISPQSQVVVYWDTSNGKTFLSISNLPAAPTGKQYQLWGIVDGKPVDAGLLTDTTDLQLMKEISGAAAFAITLEPEGGSENPTLDQMYVVGEVI